MMIRFFLKTPLVALALAWACGTGVMAGSAEEVLKLTDGRRVKVVWNQGGEGDQKLMFFDTKEGKVKELGPAGSAPLLTKDGSKIVISVGKGVERNIMVYDAESGKGSELVAAGAGNHVLALWQDPKTKRDWVYVNDSGDKGEAWNVAAGAIHRFPIDKPEERELFWDRTSSHIYLMFSEDGTRACFEPSWANIGQLNLEYDAKGQPDQDKSTYKTVGGGCFPSMAPDNSYRMFRLDGGHKGIDMTDVDGTNPRKISVTGMPGVGDAGRQIWLTRWSSDPHYLTLMGPDSNEARIWLGRFDKEFTEVEEWVAVSEEGGGKCWQSHAWIEPVGGASAPAAGAVAPGGSAGEGAALPWPKVLGPAFALRDGNPATPVAAYDASGRRLMAFSLVPRGRALMGRFDDLVCDGGAFHAKDAGRWIGQQVAKSGAFSVEASVTAAEVAPSSARVVLAYSRKDGEDLAVLQDKAGLSLRVGGAQPVALFSVVAGEAVHVLVTGDDKQWVAYRDGEVAGSGPMPAGAGAWQGGELLLGGGWGGANAWHGRLETVAIYPRVLSAEEAASQAAAVKALQAVRKPATAVRFRGTLVRQAVTSELAAIKPYTRSLSAAEYQVDEVLAGEWKQPTITVFHWMIMDAKRLALADRKPGAAVELSVEPLEEHPQLESSRRDEIAETDLDASLFYCESESAK